MTKALRQSFLLLTGFLLITITGCSQQQNANEYLVKVFDGEYDEIGTPTGYVNAQGDTIVEVGKYYYCFTDTLINFAVVLTHQQQCIAIDPNGQKMFDVFWYDNGPDYISEGLFRIKMNEKIGYANQLGQIVIQPQFNCAFPFENGKAKVSVNCKTVRDGENQLWESQTWFFIDKKGEKVGGR